MHLKRAICATPARVSLSTIVATFTLTLAHGSNAQIASAYTLTLVDIAGSSHAASEAINALGQVSVGSLDASDTPRGFLWNAGDICPTTNLPGGIGVYAQSINVAGINDAGQIVGWGKLDGVPAGSVLTPIPTPGAGLAPCLAGVLIARCKHGSDVGPGKDRQFLHIPTASGTQGHFTWAVPIGHIERSEDRFVRERAATILAGYRAKAQRIRASRGPLAHVLSLNGAMGASIDAVPVLHIQSPPTQASPIP